MKGSSRGDAVTKQLFCRFADQGAADNASTDAYSESLSGASSSEGSQLDEDEGSYFWQMLTFGYTVEWCVPDQL